MAELSPHLVWHLVDSVAVLFARSDMLARTRAISHVSPMVRMLALRDHAHTEAALFEREFGTRTIARHIIRAGIQISRTSVRRVLGEPPPNRNAHAARIQPADHIGSGAAHLLHPSKPNRVWHVDQ